MKLYKKFEPLGKFWLGELEKYNEEPFKRKPTEGEWSMGQLYNHLINHTMDFQLSSINGCFLETNGSRKGMKSIRGMIVFAKGDYLFGKVKSAENDASPPLQPKSIMEVRNNFIKLMKILNEISAQIEKMSDKSKLYKVKHPRFGMLTAEEWYETIVIHFKHHIEQKRRIDKVLMKR